MPQILQKAARGDVIREEEVWEPIPVHVGRNAAGGFHLRQDVEPRAGGRVTKMAGAVVQQESRVAARHDDVHGAVPVDVHEEHSRAMVRRGEAEVRRLHRIEGFVRRDEAAGDGLVEEMRDAPLDRGGPADSGSGAQLPTRLRRRIGGLSAKKREIEDGQSRNALRIIRAREALEANFDAQGHVRRGFLLKVDDADRRSAAEMARRPPALQQLPQRRCRRRPKSGASPSPPTF